MDSAFNGKYGYQAMRRIHFFEQLCSPCGAEGQAMLIYLVTGNEKNFEVRMRPGFDPAH